MFSRIYLDFNATTPVHPEVMPFVQKALESYGNGSSVHWAGRDAKKWVSQTREALSKLINVHPLEIIFTSGGSEANNLALKGVFADNPLLKRREIIASPVEHPSVIKTIEYLVKNHKYTVQWLKISRDGHIDIDHYKSLLTENTAFVSVQLVNNETGNIFPIKEMAKLAHEKGALFHSDMVQGLGKIQIDLKDLDVDMASFAGHKFYSLKGAGALFVRKGIHIEPLIHGGGQERGRRAGTENTLAIGCFGEAIKVLSPNIITENARLRILRDHLEKRILENIPGTVVNGAGADRVANTLNIVFNQVDGETLLINLDTQGIAVSSGAACSSGSQEPSPILRAMGLTREEASQSMRISLGWLTSQEQIDIFFAALLKAVKQIRSVSDSISIEPEREVTW